MNRIRSPKLLAIIPIASVLATLTIGLASPADQQKLASANTGFAFQLLKAIAKREPQRNLSISPYSVSTVLQMIANGAGGRTKDELQQVLGTHGLSAAALNEANSALARSLSAGSSNVILDPQGGSSILFMGVVFDPLPASQQPF